MTYPKRSRPVKTVGGLIKQLQRFPKRMKLSGDFSDAVQVVVYNHSKIAKDIGLPLHCQIEETWG